MNREVSCFPVLPRQNAERDARQVFRDKEKGLDEILQVLSLAIIFYYPELTPWERRYSPVAQNDP